MYKEDIKLLRESEIAKDIYYGEGVLRGMINSCLAYGTSKAWFLERYAKPYIETLGRDEVSRIWEDQKAFFEKNCKVKDCVYIDSEGVFYNSTIEYGISVKEFLERNGFKVAGIEEGFLISDESNGAEYQYKSFKKVEENAKMLAEAQREKIIKAMEKAGYHFDDLTSDEHCFRYNCEGQDLPLMFQNLHVNIDWLKNTCFEPEIQKNIDEIMRVPAFNPLEDILDSSKNQEIKKILEEYINEQFECGEEFVFVAKGDMQITGITTEPMYDDDPDLCSCTHGFSVHIRAGDEVCVEPDKTCYVNGVLAKGRSVSMYENRITHTINISSVLDNYDKISEKESRMINTNVGKVPIADYREIRARQQGFDNYKDLYQQGYRLGEGLDKNPLLDELLEEKEVTKVVIDWDYGKIAEDISQNITIETLKELGLSAEEYLKMPPYERINYIYDTLREQPNKIVELPAEMIIPSGIANDESRIAEYIYDKTKFSNMSFEVVPMSKSLNMSESDYQNNIIAKAVNTEWNTDDEEYDEPIELFT